MDSLDESIEREKLHFAAGNGDAAMVKLLLAKGCDPNAFDELGHTPLHYAADGEHFEVVRLLFGSGARVNACDESKAGDTALGHVAQTCSLKMAQILVAAGADPTISGGMRINAIDRARGRKRDDGPKVFELLCRTAGRTARD
jgi:ankyrin repeat protein